MFPYITSLSFSDARLILPVAADSMAFLPIVGTCRWDGPSREYGPMRCE